MEPEQGFEAHARPSGTQPQAIPGNGRSPGPGCRPTLPDQRTQTREGSRRPRLRAPLSPRRRAVPSPALSSSLRFQGVAPREQGLRAEGRRGGTLAAGGTYRRPGRAQPSPEQSPAGEGGDPPVEFPEAIPAHSKCVRVTPLLVTGSEMSRTKLF